MENIHRRNMIKLSYKQKLYFDFFPLRLKYFEVYMCCFYKREMLQDIGKQHGAAHISRARWRTITILAFEKWEYMDENSTLVYSTGLNLAWVTSDPISYKIKQ